MTAAPVLAPRERREDCWFDIEDINGEDDHEVLTALCNRLEGKR